MRWTRPRPAAAGPVARRGAGTRCSRPRSDPGRCARNSNAVTTPKLPPPPRSAQSSSGSPSGPAHDRLAGRGHDLGPDEVVAGEAGQPGSASRSRRRASGRPMPVSPNVPPATARSCAPGRRCRRRSTERRRLRPDDPRLRVDLDGAQVAQVDHERAVGDRVAGDAVPAAADRDRQSGRARARHRGHDVVGRRARTIAAGRRSSVALNVWRASS